VQTAGIIHFLAANFVTLVASDSALALIQDMYHIVPESIAVRLNIADKTLSTSTLGYQVIGLGLATIMSIFSSAALTALVFKREAKVTVYENGVAFRCPTAGMLNEFCVPLKYDQTSYSQLSSYLRIILLLMLCPVVSTN